MTSSERGRSTRTVTAILVAAIGATPLVARADAASDSHAAFVQGRELVQANQCEAAIPHFRRAFELLPTGLGALRNLANCEEQIGHFVAARRDLGTLREKLGGTRDPKYAGWEEEAAAALARVEPKIAHVRVRVGGAPAGAATAVTIDGVALDEAALAGGVDENPGRHAFEARAGAAVARASVALGPGERRDVALTFVASAPPPPRLRPSRTPVWLGVAGLALGGAALVGAGIATAVHADALSTIEAKCPTHVGCDPSLRAVHDRAAVAGPLAVGLGVGGVVLAAGGGLALLLAPRASPAPVALGGRF